MAAPPPATAQAAGAGARGQEGLPALLRSPGAAGPLFKEEEGLPVLLQSPVAAGHLLKEEAPAARRILFLGAALTGHFTPLLRLMRWFHEQGGWEVHMVPQASLLPQIPEWVVVHRPMDSEMMDGFAKKMFRDIGEQAPDWSASFVQMLTSFSEFPMADCAEQQKTAMEVIREISPSAVVADASWGLGNHLNTFCTRAGVPLAVLSCPGRPDPATSTLGIMWMLFRYGGLGKMRKMMSALGELKERVRPLSGEPLPDSQKPLMLLPGTEVLLESAPAPHELVCGPFLPLPPPVASGGFQRPADALEEAPGMCPELRRWLLSDPGVPIVYVAFGSLVRLGAGAVARLAQALRGASWRVLWVLGEECRGLLPAELRASGGGWRLESWVPQRDVLGFEGVRCFVSHCGGNSSQESLAFGVPMVCMPFFCDQFEWASAIVGHAGAGVLVDKRASSTAELRAAVRRALEDPGLAAAARRVAEGMRREARRRSAQVVRSPSAGDIPGVAVAASLIVELAEGRDPRGGFGREPAGGLLGLCARRARAAPGRRGAVR